jgi:hypothetical protein
MNVKIIGSYGVGRIRDDSKFGVDLQQQADASILAKDREQPR